MVMGNSWRACRKASLRALGYALWMGEVLSVHSASVMQTRTRAKEARMKAWRLQRLGGELRFSDVRTPEPRPGSALVRIEASALMSYLRAYVEGKLPVYNPPPGPFTIGTNGVGVVEAVGRDVWHLKPGQRVVLSSHFVAAENVEDPAQILIGLTSSPDAAQGLADWPDGTLAEYALMPVEAITPAEGLDEFDSTGLVTIGRFIIPFGGLLPGRLPPPEPLAVTHAPGPSGPPPRSLPS